MANIGEAIVGGLGAAQQFNANEQQMEMNKTREKQMQAEIAQQNWKLEQEKKREADLDRPRMIGEILGPGVAPDSETYKQISKWAMDNGIAGQDGTVTMRKIRDQRENIDLAKSFITVARGAKLEDMQNNIDGLYKERSKLEGVKGKERDLAELDKKIMDFRRQQSGVLKRTEDGLKVVTQLEERRETERMKKQEDMQKEKSREESAYKLMTDKIRLEKEAGKYDKKGHGGGGEKKEKEGTIKRKQLEEDVKQEAPNAPSAGVRAKVAAGLRKGDLPSKELRERETERAMRKKKKEGGNAKDIFTAGADVWGLDDATLLRLGKSILRK